MTTTPPHADHDHDHDHDRGLAHDLATLVDRRRALKLFSVAGLATLAACGSSKLSSGSTAGTSATTATASSGAATSSVTTAIASTSTPASAATDVSTAIPEETAGPYPGDGSNGKNVLTQSGIVRSDIRSSLGGGTTAAGVPFTIRLQIVKVGTGAALAGLAVYLWHCDINGNYSMYSAAVTGETYLRGVQETGSDGFVTFSSIFPACYDGRWPHVHFEVYPNLARATSSANKIATSQLALPEATCKTVYATSGYEQSVSNLSKVSLATDNVFSDGATQETPTMTGSVSSGLTATLVVPVKA